MAEHQVSVPVANEVDSVPTEASLEVLAKVTRDYAVTGNSLFGLALLPPGLCLLSAGTVQWMAAAKGGWTDLDLLAAGLALAAPPLAPLTAVFTQPRYQRHGRVAEPVERAGPVRPSPCYLMGIVGWIALASWQLAAVLGVSSFRDVPGDVPLRAIHLLTLGSAVATGALVLWRRPRRGDMSWFLAPVLGETVAIPLGRLYAYVRPVEARVAEQAFVGLDPTKRTPVLLLFTGLALLVAAVATHVWYRRLQARLKALRGTP
jgi:hypothetical protein